MQPEVRASHRANGDADGAKEIEAHPPAECVSLAPYHLEAHRISSNPYLRSALRAWRATKGRANNHVDLLPRTVVVIVPGRSVFWTGLTWPITSS